MRTPMPRGSENVAEGGACKKEQRTATWLVLALLTVHAGLLAWMAYRDSPTTDEPALLVAGLSHWDLDSFELYRVNPPLVRMAAAFPVWCASPITDWRTVDARPGARSELPTARSFMRDNGQRIFWFMTMARWACVPFSLIGAYACFLWARDLFGAPSGCLALFLWCFCPNILAHGHLITTDVPAAALGVLAYYAFWKWLRAPTWRLALLSGLAFGATELTKTTWLILYGAWPLTWLAWRIANPGPAGSRTISQAVQLACMLCLGTLIVDTGYQFRGCFKPLGSYQFVSEALAGADKGMGTGNRFAKTLMAQVPVPFPEDYVLGIDTQKLDLERPFWSYLNGEYRQEGWWYFYLFALAIKVPVGTWLLFCLL